MPVWFFSLDKEIRGEKKKYREKKERWEKSSFFILLLMT